MRKGDRLNSWTTAEERYLRDSAGKVDRRTICRTLKRSRKSVERKSSRLGLSLRVHRSKLVWCDRCASWRTSLDEQTGHCIVCAKRDKLEGYESRLSEVFSQLPAELQAEHQRQEAHRGERKPLPIPQRTLEGASPVERAKAEEAYAIAVERWEIRRLDKAYDRSKTELKRMREKLGTNPRKK